MVYLPIYQIPNDHQLRSDISESPSDVKTSGGSLQDPSSSAMCAMGPWGCVGDCDLHKLGYTRPGKHTQNDGKSRFLIGKSTPRGSMYGIFTYIDP